MSDRADRAVTTDRLDAIADRTHLHFMVVAKRGAILGQKESSARENEIAVKGITLK
jgi:hypothetical protein